MGMIISQQGLSWLGAVTALTLTVAAFILAKKMENKQSASQKSAEGTTKSAEGTSQSIFKNERFYNPFETWRERGLTTLFKWKLFHKDNTNLPATEEELNSVLPVLKPTFHDEPPDSGMNVTWLGHATTLVQFDGVNILTDPVFSSRCGPVQAAGLSYKRFRPAPCTVRDLPQLHAVVISHSHYDHLDYQSVVDLNKRFQEGLHWFVPLKLKSWFTSLGCQNVHELNWWQEEKLPNHPDVKLVFTPTQHWSGRKLLDSNKTLWGSWCVIGPNHRYYFAGDTGYCEAFKQIGEKYGPFDLAAIPIGAYLPREIMTPQHVEPSQAVDIHKDVQAEKSIGIHWGTFALAYENYQQPPKDLAEALKEKEVSDEDFFVLKHGEQRMISK